MEQITLRLENFQGPLSLLYHLIEKNKVDIYDIPIAEITEQYMEVIYSSEIMDMEIMSSFIVMAATLMEIKSKMLLPKPAKADDEEEVDPREELVNRLIEYRKYCEAAKELKEKEEKYSRRLYKEPDPALNDIKKDYEQSLSEFMNGVTFDDLAKAFKTVMERKDLKTDKVRSGFKSVERDEFTIEEKIDYLKELLYLTPKVKFEDVFSHSTTRSEVAVTFLAVLELIKTGFIRVSQEYNFGSIEICRNREIQEVEE